MHVEGTTRPRAPIRPEFIKSDVYFPSHLAGTRPNTTAAVNRLVQTFIEDIGTATISSFSDRVARQWGASPAVASIPPLVPGPFPSPNPLASDRHICHGTVVAIPIPVPAIPQPFIPATVPQPVLPAAVPQPILPPPTPSRRLPTPTSTPIRRRPASNVTARSPADTVESSDSDDRADTPRRLEAWRMDQMSPDKDITRVQQAYRRIVTLEDQVWNLHQDLSASQAREQQLRLEVLFPNGIPPSPQRTYSRGQSTASSTLASTSLLSASSSSSSSSSHAWRTPDHCSGRLPREMRHAVQTEEERTAEALMVALCMLDMERHTNTVLSITMERKPKHWLSDLAEIHFPQNVPLGRFISLMQQYRDARQ